MRAEIAGDFCPHLRVAKLASVDRFSSGKYDLQGIGEQPDKAPKVRRNRPRAEQE
jgi:hypothetical protein